MANCVRRSNALLGYRFRDVLLTLLRVMYS
jgi:hypothetical protein